MVQIKFIISATFALGAWALPQGAAENKRCTFNDGVGDVGCDSWSITFGDNTPTNDDSQAVAVYGPDGFKVAHDLDCDKAHNEPNSYQTFVDSGLHYTVSIHPGNACKPTIGGGAYDNTWVNYANQHIDIPSDDRCDSALYGGKGIRCIIPLDP